MSNNTTGTRSSPSTQVSAPSPMLYLKEPGLLGRIAESRIGGKEEPGKTVVPESKEVFKEWR